MLIFSFFLFIVIILLRRLILINYNKKKVEEEIQRMKEQKGKKVFRIIMVFCFKLRSFVFIFVIWVFQEEVVRCICEILDIFIFLERNFIVDIVLIFYRRQRRFGLGLLEGGYLSYQYIYVLIKDKVMFINDYMCIYGCDVYMCVYKGFNIILVCLLIFVECLV